MSPKQATASPVPVYLPVDARIRRRRAEVARAEGRRRLRVLVGATVLSVATVAGWGSLRSALLDVDKVVVEGAAHLGVGEVVAASLVARGQAMVDVDAPAAARAIETLPWVARAEVSRSWPGRVMIRVTERAAVALASTDDGAWSLLDRGGLVLDQVADRPPGLVVVTTGAPAVPPGSVLSGVDDLVAVAASVPGAVRPAVEAVAYGDAGIELRLRPGGVVRMGSAESLAEKFRALATVLGRVDTSGMVSLDLRHPSSPALTRAQNPSRVSTISAG